MESRARISIGLLFLTALLAPSVAAEMRPTAPAGARPEVKGTIGYADERGVGVILKSGQHLLVPLTVNVRHVLLTPPRAIKAYYEPTAAGNVVTSIVVEELQPGSGG